MATKAKAPKKTRGANAQGTAKRRIRKIFGDIHEVVDMPNLIEVQRESYEHFLAVAPPDCGSVVGPSEKAPYTHWMPLPAPPEPHQGRGGGE